MDPKKPQNTLSFSSNSAVKAVPDGYSGTKETLESTTYNQAAGHSAKRLTGLLQRIRSEYFVFDLKLKVE